MMTGSVAALRAAALRAERSGMTGLSRTYFAALAALGSWMAKLSNSESVWWTEHTERWDAKAKGRAA